MRFDLVSIFPQFFDVLELSLLGKAQENHHLQVVSHDLREWSEGKHRTVDSPPAGGGAGMVMRPDVWGRALDHVLGQGTGKQIIAVPTPAGTPLTQKLARTLSEADQIIVACGRYEGIDSRVVESYRANGVEVLEYSIGDYVLNGGEVAAIVLVEAVGRLVGGVVGNPHSLEEESHWQTGVLEYPIYTQPRCWRDRCIPEVLLSGDHKRIASWRRAQALERTVQARPDLVWQIDRDSLSQSDLDLLAEKGFQLVPSAGEITYRSISDQPNSFVLGAEVDGVLRAHIRVQGQCPAKIKCDSQTLFLSDLYVDPLSREGGLAAGVLEHALRRGAEHFDGVSAAVAVPIADKWQRRFYLHHGFRKNGRARLPVSSGADLFDVLTRQL